MSFTSDAKQAIELISVMIDAFVRTKRNLDREESIYGIDGYTRFDIEHSSQPIFQASLPNDLRKALVSKMAQYRPEEYTFVFWDDGIREAAANGHECFLGLEIPNEHRPKGPEIWFEHIGNGYELKGDELTTMELVPGSLTCGVLFVFPFEKRLFMVAPFLLPVTPGQARGLYPAFRSDYTEWAECKEGMTPFAARLAFMREQISERKKAEFTKKDLRQLHRSKEQIPEIHRVVLRRIAAPGYEAPGSGSGREYSCQWAVRGHWRKMERYGKQPRFILPYVKGPNDKPFRAAKQTVVQVKR